MSTSMNHLSPRDRELVALGAAMGSNCVRCIEYHVPEARNAGLTSLEISEAIRLADTVRQVPARKVLDAARRMLPEVPAGAPAGENTCAGAPAQAEAGAMCCDSPD